MRALSIRQPWAWAIVHASKRIENRGWSTRYRGPLLIHASKGIGTRDDFDDACEAIFELDPVAFEDLRRHLLPEQTEHDGEVLYAPGPSLERGGIVGGCVLVDVIGPGVQGIERVPGLDLRWHVESQFGLVLDKVRALPFRPFPGALGFFEVPPRDDVVEGRRR